jgi:hypothetical protein
MSQEEEIQAMIAKMNQLKNYPTTDVHNNQSQFDNQGVNSGFVQTQGGGEFDNQGPSKPATITPIPKPQVNPQSGQPNLINTTGVQVGVAPTPVKLDNVCPQCGMAHPPLPAGEKCPNASIANEVKEFKLNEAQINTYIVNIRNIVISKLSEKNIKDGTKFFQYAIVELSKSLDKYNE